MKLILDANNLAFRADRTQHLTTKQGEHVGAIYGVIQMLQSYLKPSEGKYTNYIFKALEGDERAEEGFSSVYTCWDAGKSAFRSKLYPEYKAQRKVRRDSKTEEEKERYAAFLEQMNTLHEKLRIFGVKSLKSWGWEADDLIYALTRLNEEEDKELCIIVSTDKDMLQLVSSNVYVWNPNQNEMYKPENFESLTGFRQAVYLSMRILVGDSSDNIPGIEGIGEVTAKKLFNTYGDLKGIIANRAELSKKKTTNRIFENIDILDRNDALMNMKRIPVQVISDYVKEEMKKQSNFRTPEVKRFFMRYQFVSLLKYINQMEKTFGNLD